MVHNRFQVAAIPKHQGMDVLKVEKKSTSRWFLRLGKAWSAALLINLS